MSPKWRAAIVTVLAAAVGGIGLLSLLGYLTGYERLAAWYGDTPMALSSATALLFIAPALWLLAMHLTEPVQHREPVLQLTDRDFRVISRFCPADVVALFCTVGSFVMIAIDKDGAAIGVLVAVTGYYFGRLGGVVGPAKPKEPPGPQP